MTTEQRLSEALSATRAYEASPDLWSRVVHSIEEDRAHRRLAIVTAAALVALLVGSVAIAALSLESQSGQRRIDWRLMEALEFVALVALVAALGPVIRRFGRGYVGDIFVTSQYTGPQLLGLLDIAYYLVFSSYVLITTRFAAPDAFRFFSIGGQLQEAAIRIGGLLLMMGVLHAATLMVMPLVGLVFNTTRAGRKLPRWVTYLLILIAVLVALQGIPALGAMFAGSE